MSERIDRMVVDAIENLGDRLVEVIEGKTLTEPRIVKLTLGLMMQMPCDERVRLATELLEGTSMKVTPR